MQFVTVSIRDPTSITITMGSVAIVNGRRCSLVRSMYYGIAPPDVGRRIVTFDQPVARSDTTVKATSAMVLLEWVDSETSFSIDH